MRAEERIDRILKVLRESREVMTSRDIAFKCNFSIHTTRRYLRLLRKGYGGLIVTGDRTFSGPRGWVGATWYYELTEVRDE
jgi:DeoR/GlpR family transcriptional regulator of sugar metabolism